MKALVVAVLASFPFARASTAQAGAASVAISDSSAVYSGVYMSTFTESIFSPCDVPGIGSGWWTRFANERDAPFVFFRQARPGMGTVTHFVRIRGRVSPPGHYGLGFQTREIVVDSVLEVSETPRPCKSYEEVPLPWNAIRANGAPIIAAAIGDDNATLAVFDRSGIVRIWNTQRGTLTRQFESPRIERLWSWRVPMQFSDDRKQLAVSGDDGVVRIWNPADGQILWILPADDSAQSTVNGQRRPNGTLGLAFNRSGTLLANMQAGRTSVWSTVTGKRVGKISGGYAGASLRFRGDTPVVTGADSSLRQRLAIPQPTGEAQPAFSPDGKLVAVAGGANALYVSQTGTGQPLRSFQKYPNAIQKVWFTPDSRALVSYSMWDSVFRIVRFAPKTRQPVQAWWSGQLRREPPSGGPFGSVFGFVRDSAKKKIVGAEVLIFDGDHPGGFALARTTTNAAGRFLLQKIMARHVVVFARKQGFVTGTQYTHLPAIEAPIDFVLKPER